MDNIYFEKALETIFHQITDNMPSEICETCPVVQMIGDVMDMIKNENYSSVASQLGIDGVVLQCPYKKD